MQYTEEHYAEMYNNLPEGLKDLVLSGRLAILVSAIGSRHGLNADQIADLEPAIEDVCLGLVTNDELVENILKTVHVDQRVANRIAAEAELEILKPFGAELIIARKQKEDLDAKIASGQKKATIQAQINANGGKPIEPKDVSGHAENKKVSDWYAKGERKEGDSENSKNIPAGGVTFDWDKDFAKKEEVPVESTGTQGSPDLEKKLDVLTESINKLVNVRFGEGEKKDEVSGQMQELLKRLERAEKENEENKKLIKSLAGSKPGENIFGANALKTENKVSIDKERKVDINHMEPKVEVSKDGVTPNGNIQITSTSRAIPIVSSSVSKDTVDSIVETRNKITPLGSADVIQSSAKKALSLDELVAKGDGKIKDGLGKSGTLVFPGLNDEKKVDIKNVGQKENLKQTLLDDLEFLKKTEVPTGGEKQNSTPTDTGVAQVTQPEVQEEIEQDPAGNDLAAQIAPSTSPSTTNPFKDELLPKTKEERMKALQDKIKALNKGVSVGGKSNISASGLDPYRL